MFPDVAKPLIAMAHLPALPGTPLYDGSGMTSIVEQVQRDVDALVEAGFDEIMFCNENDRPYELMAAPRAPPSLPASSASAGHGRSPTESTSCGTHASPSPPRRRPARHSCREVVTGVWESDMGLLRPDAARTLHERRRLGVDELAVLMNMTPEFASPIGSRSAAEVARSVAVSSIPDAILVSGPMAGASPDLSVLVAVRDAVPSDVPVLLNTGARAETIAEFLTIADGCIVGSSLKVDGYTWNPVDPDRARQFVAAAAA